MAENIVESMFGPTPYQIEQQQRAASDAKAAAMAKMGGFELAGYLGGQAGAGLARPIAGMMGMVNPQVEEAKQKQAVLSGVDFNDPNSILQHAAQAQDPRLKMQLIQLAQSREEKLVDIELKKTNAKYYGMGGRGSSANVPAQLAAAIARSDKDIAQQGNMSNWTQAQITAAQEANERRLVEVYNRSGAIPGIQTTQQQQNIQSNEYGTFGELPGGVQLNIVGPLTKEAKQAIIADMVRNGETNAAREFSKIPLGTDISGLQTRAKGVGQITAEKEAQKIVETTTNGGQAAFSSAGDAMGQTPAQYSPMVKAKTAAGAEGGKSGIELNMKDYGVATSASQSIPKIDALIAQLEKGDVITGAAADLRLGLTRAISLLGGKDAAKKASDTQIADVLMGSEVFPLLQSLGIGSKNMDTPAEREFMRKVLTGELALEKDTLLIMAKMRKDAAVDSVNRFNDKIETGELDMFFNSTSIPKRKISSSSSGITAPNGMKLIGKTPDGKNVYQDDTGKKWVQ